MAIDNCRKENGGEAIKHWFGELVTIGWISWVWARRGNSKGNCGVEIGFGGVVGVVEDGIDEVVVVIGG